MLAVEARAISPNIAKFVASVCALFLVGSGIVQFLPNLRHPLFALALVVAGLAILFARSWGYFILYLITFASLMPPQSNSLVPIGGTVRRFLWLHAGFERELTVVLLNLIFAGLLAWTHLVLYRAGRLDYRLSANVRERVVVAGLLLSVAAVLLPLMAFIYAIIVDPPGLGGPAAPGGGMKAFIVLVITWPIALAGSIGVVVFRRLLRHSRGNESDD